MRPKEIRGSERKALRLREQFRRLGVRAVCVDLDSNLIETTEIFSVAMVDACGILWSDSRVAPRARAAFGDPQNLKEEFMDKAIWALRPELGVNPAVMRMGVFLTARRLGLNLNSDQVEEAIDRVERIYTHDIPPLFPGAIEAVDLINASGVDSFLITHSDPDWAWGKILAVGLQGKFKQIVCFKTWEPKSVQWKPEVQKLGLDPEEALSIGDNWRADVVPVIKLGGRGVWVSRQSKMYDAEPETDEDLIKEERRRVKVVEKIGEVIEAILRW